MTKWLALTAIGVQLTLGLILVAILFTLQGAPTLSEPVGPIHVVVDPVPTCVSTWSFQCPTVPVPPEKGERPSTRYQPPVAP